MAHKTCSISVWGAVPILWAGTDLQDIYSTSCFWTWRVGTFQIECIPIDVYLQFNNSSCASHSFKERI